MTGATLIGNGSARRCAWPRSAFAAGVLALAVTACRESRRAPATGAGAPPLSIGALLSDAPGAGSSGSGETVDRDGDGAYERALAPRAFIFPDDDGPHPTFRSEWWYFTGVLRAAGAGATARRFGYQMTIFRQAIARDRAARPSAWATRDIFMANLALGDIDGPAGDGRFHAYERFARDGLGLAGATARPFAAWVDDWRMQGPADAKTETKTALPVHLTARDDDGGAIDLVVGIGQDQAGGGGTGPIAEGDRGLAAKGPLPGNASFYYSRTSLPTRGRLTLPLTAAAPPQSSRSAVERTYEVTGVSWMDREWGTGALGAGVHGWDWLGVHLAGGGDLMMYRLRDAQGHATAQSLLTLIAADGRTRSFGPDRFTLVPVATWVSPRSGARYPTSFQIDVPDQRTRFVIRPLLVDQELALAVNYWEGAVGLEGMIDGAAVAGEGYLELTGYDGRGAQRQR